MKCRFEVCVRAVEPDNSEMETDSRCVCLISGFAYVTMTDGVVLHLSMVAVYTDMEWRDPVALCHLNLLVRP